MKKLMNGRVYLLYFLLLFIHYPLITNGYNHRLTNEKFNWKSKRREQNFGTVLFDKSDIEKECWNNDELTLLNSRIIFNNILPQADLIDGNDDKYIDKFMDYVDICWEIVQKLASGKAKHLVVKALADTIGGYLHVFIIPLTKNSYYAGNIKYEKAKLIFDLYDDLKSFLRTNGVGWFKPMSNHHHHLRVSSIFIPHSKRSRRAQICSNLIIYPDNDDSLVPIPFLDDNETPSSIALPYENESLSSLFTAKSAFILVKYYTDGINCISSSSSSVDNNHLNKFKRQLNDWLCNIVKPLLNNDKWYPAFGGVLRVMASLETDVDSRSQEYNNEHNLSSDNYIDTESAQKVSLKKLFNTQFDFTEIFIITMSILVLIYFLISICTNCYIVRSKERRKIQAFKKTPIYEFYKKPEKSYTRSARSTRSTLLKSFNNCPCSDEDDKEKYLNELTYTSISNSATSPTRNKFIKSLSAPTVQRGSSIGQPVDYTSCNETSTFSPSATPHRLSYK